MTDHFSTLSDAERVATDAIIQQMKEDHASLWDVFKNADHSVPIHITHDQSSSMIALGLLGELTETGRKDFSSLLEAHVKEVRAGEYGLEVIVDGIGPEELERFRLAYEAHEQAEQAMGPVM